jgi:Flp pilus assembly protein TadD
MAVGLFLATLALYWPATSHDFIVSFDDDLVVTSNIHVQSGLNWEGVKWSFSHPVNSIWHPLTVLSHMLDCQLFGMKPWGHHLTSVLLHAANTVLLFLLLRQMTGACWRSALTAAVFGLHPLHVESVAWVAERKDVLSTFFGLLSLICYVRYAQRQGARNKEQGTSIPSILTPYFLSLFFFALGLMSKPMLVTWPLVMLLLDWWPLDRFKAQGSGFRVLGLAWEKLPFFGLSTILCVVTYLVQQRTGLLTSVEILPLDARIGNALISYCRYVGKLFWPVNLAVLYPHPGYWPMRLVLPAGGVLLVVTVLFVLARRQYPFLLVGWLWFIGTLVPVIQLIQTGDHALADRYTYIPSVGVLILTIWGVYELTGRWRGQRITLLVASCTTIVLCFVVARLQLRYWTDSETLWRHTLEVTENNPIAHNGLGVTLNMKGRTDEAISQFQEAIRLLPNYAKAYNNLGVAFDEKNQIDEAVRCYREAIRLASDYAATHNNLGIVLGRKGQINEAIDQFQEAIRLKPDYAEAHYNLGTALGMEGRTDEAIGQFQEAIRLKPDFAEAHSNLIHALELKNVPPAH